MAIKNEEALVDSNILVYFSNTLSPKYKEAVKFRKLALDGYFIPIVSHQNIMEMTRVLTHKKYKNPFTLKEALFQSKNVQKMCKVIYPLNDTLEIALNLLEKYTITSNGVFDCYLVATMISNGIRIIASDNTKDLSVFKEIEVYNPFE